MLGPGLISGAADDDPSGIVVMSQAGAAYSYSLLWTATWQLPLMSAVQLLAARIAIITGRDLPQIIAKRYPAWVVFAVAALVTVANTVTVAADLAGVGLGFRLLTHLPLVAFEVATAVALVLLVVLAKYWSIRSVLKWLTLLLLVYVVSAIAAKPHWSQVLLNSFIPRVQWNRDYATMWVAVFGTTISPYVFIWQSAEEVEEHPREAHRGRRLTSDLRSMTGDTVFGMTVSQVIAYAIMLASAATLYPAGLRAPQTGREIALALQPIAGGYGTVLFAIGLIATGLVAIPTLLGASAYCVSAAFRQRASFKAKPPTAKVFYGSLIVGATLGLLLDLVGATPVGLLFLAGVVNGLLAPPLLVIMLILANDRTLVGERTPSKLVNILAGITILLMTVGAGFVAIAWLVSVVSR